MSLFSRLWKKIQNSKIEIRHFVLLCLTLVLFTLHSHGKIEGFLNSLGKEELSAQNKEFLANAETEAIESFVIFTGLKSGISIIQSSSVGISFFVDVQVQVGKVLESLKELVDYAWMASLLGMVSLHSMELFLGWSELLAAPSFYLFLFFMGTHSIILMFVPKLALYSAKATGIFLFLVIVTYILTPASIYAGFITSSYITSPVVKEIRKEVRSEHKDLFVHNQTDGIKSQAHKAITAYSDVSGTIDDKTGHLTSYVVKHIAVTFFDVFLFPATFFLLLAGFFKKSITVFFLKTNNSLLASELSLSNHKIFKNN